MARPKKQEHEKRSEKLTTVRVTPAERIFIEDKAAAAGFTVTDFLRTLALHEEVKPRKTKLESSVLVELNRIGNNVNQIARVVNIGRIDTNLIQSSLNELRELMAKIDAAL